MAEGVTGTWSFLTLLTALVALWPALTWSSRRRGGGGSSSSRSAYAANIACGIWLGVLSYTNLSALPATNRWGMCCVTIVPMVARDVSRYGSTTVRRLLLIVFQVPASRKKKARAVVDPTRHTTVTAAWRIASRSYRRPRSSTIS